jgi:ribosomal protein S27AE
MSHEGQIKQPMVCKKCGAVMNHHAVKIDYSVEDASDDAAFGGALQEVHTCPNCGHAQLRQV